MATKTKKNEKEPEQVSQPVVTEETAQETEQPAEPQTEQMVTLTASEFEQVRAHIETLQKEKDEAVQAAQRLQAEFDNYRRRNASLRTDSIDEGTRECIKSLLPALDNFDRALEHAQTLDEAWLKGIELVQKQLLEALAAQGLKEIPSDGEFDPNLHNAVMHIDDDNYGTEEIVEVFQKGYRIGDSVVRHSMVKVAN